MNLIAQTIELIGQEEGYTLIFNQIQSGLVFVGPTLDITDELIQRVNALSAPSGL